MNHQSDGDYQASTSSYYSNYQSDFQLNPNTPHNPQFDHFPSATIASAPPDPSSYYSSDYYNNYPNDHHNPTVQDFASSDPRYDPNSMPLWYNHQNQTPANFGGSTINENVYGYPGGNIGTTAARFDDYGRPLNFSKNEEILKTDQSVYANNGGGNNVSENESSRLPALRFDDYGRPITNGNNSVNDKRGLNTSLEGDKMLKSTPKLEDVSSGVQKFRVMLLSEGDGGVPGDMDVLCQIGLDGIRLLDPATSRTLKVYALDTVTRWEVLDSYIFAFWTKSSIDNNPRRVRLKSNTYTISNILDMVAAASIQFKEMDEVTVSEQLAEKKKGFPDWINLMKPGNEEKDHWVPDEASIKCTGCNTYFGAFVRRHHCRNCGDIFCDKCTQGRIALTAEEHAQQVRVCDQCMAEVTQRLSHANEVAGSASGYYRHEDLAKKLQEEMEKKRKTLAELKSNVPNERMKEVECPTCTVHLQVEVPASGSKTIECSVCQHPFLVNAR